LYASLNIIRLIKSRSIKMDRTCNVQRSNEKCMQNFNQKTWMEETTWEISA